MKKKIFVTGAGGFIARNVVEQLGSKYSFISPTHLQLDLEKDAEVERFFKKEGPFDVILHCANVGGTRRNIDGGEIVAKNLRMFFNLARNKKYFGKMINLGSGAEYGKDRPIVKIREGDFDKKVPTDYYGFAKYICAKYIIDSGQKMINLRLFGVWGKYEDWRTRFISNAIVRSIFKLPIVINQNVTFDYSHVDDLVKIVDYLVGNSTKLRVYNVGRGAQIDLVSIANKINSFSYKKSQIKIIKKGFANEYTCNNQLLMNELDDFKFTDFDRSLSNLYAWYKDNIGSLTKAVILKESR